MGRQCGLGPELLRNCLVELLSLFEGGLRTFTLDIVAIV